MDRWPQRLRFKALVSEFRASHKLKRKDVAEALGLAEPTLHNYLYNRRLSPSIDVIQRASRLFGVSITELVDDPGTGMAGIEASEFGMATEADRTITLEVFRDLLTLRPEQKQAAFEMWKATLKAITGASSK